MMLVLDKLSNFLSFSCCSGDRTPKAKLKMKVTQDKLLKLMMKYNGGRPRAEVRKQESLVIYLVSDQLRNFSLICVLFSSNK